MPINKYNKKNSKSLITRKILWGNEKNFKLKKKIKHSCKDNYHNAVTLRSLRTSSQVKMLEDSAKKKKRCWKGANGSEE